MKRKNKSSIIISFVAYIGGSNNHINLSQHYYFGNAYFSLDEYNKESNWENIKMIIANTANESNKAVPGDNNYINSGSIAILNVLEN